MSKVYKSLQNGPFFEIDEYRKKAIILLFEDELSNEEIAKKVNRSRQTLNKWKKDPKFKAAQEQYKQLIVKDKFESKALKRLIELIDAKSEMVQLQAVTTILKMAGRLSENSTPELDKAKIRKANAEADTAEANALLKAFEVQIRQEEFGTDETEERTDDLASAVQDGMKGVFGNGDEIET